jgi:hypothetical protein
MNTRPKFRTKKVKHLEFSGFCYGAAIIFANQTDEALMRH